MSNNFIIILSPTHYKGLLILLSYGPALGLVMICPKLVAIWGHNCICSLLPLPLLPPSSSPSSFTVGQWRKKIICLFRKTATNDHLQSPARVKNVRPLTHRLAMILPRKCSQALGSIYFVVWHDKVAVFLRRRYSSIKRNQEKK